MDKQEQVTHTSALWQRLFKSPTVNQYIAANDAAMNLPKFSDYITDLCRERGEIPEHVINRACIERSYGHHLFRGTRNPSRDTVLQIAFGLNLDVEETQQLLKIAHMTALHPKVKRDAVIAHCLYNHETTMTARLVLHELDLPLLGGICDGQKKCNR